MIHLRIVHSLFICSFELSIQIDFYLAPTPLVKIYLKTEHQVPCDDEFLQLLC